MSIVWAVLEVLEALELFEVLKVLKTLLLLEMMKALEGVMQEYKSYGFAQIGYDSSEIDQIFSGH